MVDEALRQHRRRRLDVVEGDHRLDARLPGGGRHRLGLGERHRQRLLAIDMLAGGDGGQRHFGVHQIRRGNVYDVHSRVGDELSPVPGGLLEAEARGRAFRQCVGGVGEHVEMGDRREITIEGCCAAERVGVRLAHETRTDEADIQTFGHDEIPRVSGEQVHGVGEGARDGGLGRAFAGSCSASTTIQPR